MKYLRPLMLVIAGFVIAMLVSFKNEEPKKEYAKLRSDTYKKFIVIFSDGITKEFNIEAPGKDWSNQFHVEEMKIIGKMSQDGWSLILKDNAEFYFERIK